MIDNITGEVKRFPTIYDKILKSKQDLSRIYEDVYEEIPPYAVDLKTGDLLNKTPNPIIRLVGKRNIQETIQSFADEVDIYKILERVAISGDSSLLNRKLGSFGDFVNLPDNINDLNDYIKQAFEKHKNVDKDILEAAINKSLSSSDLQAIITKHVEAAVKAATDNKIIENGGNNNG